MDAPAAVAVALIVALERTDGLVSAYLFGSAANGRTHAESDLDVGVVLDWRQYSSARQRFDVRLRLIGLLRQAAGLEPDVVVLNDAPPQLGRHIMTAGRPLVIRDADRDHAHLRVTLSRAADIEPFLRRTRAVKLAALGR
ncbi:MAG: type VII toxin-antitoxin system MntA family adenylyltransferase antitoxin [Vicinamibacterales bacterium]